MSDRDNDKKILIDFSKLDASIEVLLSIISRRYTKKQTDVKAKTNIRTTNCVKKKLNTELIRNIIMETKKNKKHKNLK